MIVQDCSRSALSKQKKRKQQHVFQITSYRNEVTHASLQKDLPCKATCCLRIPGGSCELHRPQVSATENASRRRKGKREKRCAARLVKCHDAGLTRCILFARGLGLRV